MCSDFFAFLLNFLQGNLFAYASSYDWSKGSMHVQPGNEIFIHYVVEDEIRQKSKKSSLGFKR